MPAASVVAAASRMSFVVVREIAPPAVIVLPKTTWPCEMVSVPPISWLLVKRFVTPADKETLFTKAPAPPSFPKPADWPSEMVPVPAVIVRLFVSPFVA